MGQYIQNSKLLGIFHFILAGLLIIPFGFLLLNIITAIIALFLVRQPDSGVSPNLIMFIIIPSAIVVAGCLFISCLIITGLKLYRNRSWLFCMIIAVTECIVFPFCTILGIFTIIFLTREPVRNLFMAHATETKQNLQ